MIETYTYFYAECDKCEVEVESDHYAFSEVKKSGRCRYLASDFDAGLVKDGWQVSEDDGTVLCSECRKENPRFNSMDRLIIRRSRLSDEQLAAAYKTTPNAINRCREGKDAL